MIELRGDELHISFPEVHPKAAVSVNFQRTLRVPDDNQDYPLPAGLGRFPLHPVDDYPVPTHWAEHGGVFLPMYQSEAVWISFSGRHYGYPFAIKIAAGKINAVTGAAWCNKFQRAPQDYVVVPTQPWLDGFNVGANVVRQFVAAPLGDGLTAEEQITGEAEWGGLQIIACPMKAEEYRQRFEMSEACSQDDLDIPMFCRRQVDDEMGLAPGGRIKQEISEDPYGLDVWDTTQTSRCFVHLLNSRAYQHLTGRPSPTQPVTPKQYKAASIPWFDYYSEGPALPGSSILAKLDGLAARLLKHGKALQHNEPIKVSTPIRLRDTAATVRDGQF